jgi:hypothetical protein
MVDPPLAPARLSNHRAMRMEGPRFHTGRPVPYRQRARPRSRGDDHNHLTTGRHPSLRFTAGPSRARRLRERVQADLSGRSSSVSIAMAIPSLSVFTITGRPICWAAALMARVYMTSVS